ncbi:MAG: phage tail tape measure protein [Rhizobiales bacterium]|nr:phage tail tape measure protein [Hyphomicrobiales bacterium]
MGVQTSQLIVSLLDRLSAPARLATAAVEKLQAASARNAAALDKMRGQMMDAVGAGYALFNGLSAPVKAAIGFEEKMADIGKVVDFDTPKAFKQMGDDLRQMSLRIPIAAEGLADITAAAGQSGIANNDLLKFTELSAKVATAWGVTAKDAGDGLAKLKTSLGMTVDETASLADAINFLSNKTASEAPELLTFTKSVAPMASAFGFSADQAAALGAAMISSGFQADVAATSFLNMGLALSEGEGAKKGLRAALESIGLEAEDVAELLQQNAVGTLDDVLSRIRKLPKAAQASTLTGIFGKEARALTPLLTNEKLLAEVMGYVADKTKYAGSAQDEFEKRSKTTANALQIFKNQVSDLSISVGDALLPALNKIMDTVGPVITNISDLAQRFPQATAAIVTATSTVIGFRVAITAMRFAGLYASGGVIRMGASFVGLAVNAMNAASTVKTAFSTISTAMTGGAGRRAAVDAAANAKAVADQTRKAYESALAMRELARAGQVAGVSMKDANAAVAAAGKEAAAAQVALSAANAQLAATGPGARAAAAGMTVLKGALNAVKIAVIGTGIGAAIAGIALAGSWVYNNWSGIETMFVGIGRGIRDALPGAGAIIDTVSDAVSTLIGWIKQIVGPIDATELQWRKFGYGVGQTIGEIVTKIGELPGKISAMAADMVAAGVALMNGLWDGIKQVMDQIVAYIKNAILDAVNSATATMNKITSKLTFGYFGGETPTPSSDTPAIDGARAAGGPVRSGGTYLVGEHGPELFSPGKSGMISPHEAYRAAYAGQAAGASGATPATPASSGQPVFNQVFNFAIHAGPAGDRISRETMQKIGWEIKHTLEASWGGGGAGL